MRVLIVEDEVLVALDLASMIEELGHEVVGPAHNLEEGLALASDNALDFALLDVNLGAVDSSPIAKVLRDADTPFSFLTGYAKKHLPPEFQDAQVISKPCRPEDLTGLLNQVRVD